MNFIRKLYSVNKVHNQIKYVYLIQGICPDFHLCYDTDEFDPSFRHLESLHLHCILFLNLRYFTVNIVLLLYIYYICTPSEYFETFASRNTGIVVLIKLFLHG